MFAMKLRLICLVPKRHGVGGSISLPWQTVSFSWKVLYEAEAAGADGVDGGFPKNERSTAV